MSGSASPKPTETLRLAYVMPNAFIAAVIGSEKNTGSTRSTMSPETSRKFRLFSSGISALRAPLSIATCNGSARDRIALMFPWMLRSPRMTVARLDWQSLEGRVDGDDQGNPGLASDMIARAGRWLQRGNPSYRPAGRRPS